ncbi:MAG: arginine--tRNA ligase [Saprospiraceae bacterium]|nr:arginine--tRNA ligase [Saprospiraceae bacterium]MCB9328629.1 arginine--tRNA ligase [Lewinellaceae bacterium]
MGNFQTKLKTDFVLIFKEIYDVDIDDSAVIVNQTKPEFEGEYTLVMFPYSKQLSKAPQVIGNEVGSAFKSKAYIDDFNVVQGFLNLKMSNEFWIEQIHENHLIIENTNDSSRKIMVEFASPNTNKPLHLGHIRNILLGWSVSQILEKAGYEVVKTQIINDRGIAICKSMLAWQLYGEGKTPSSTDIKGDHFVGDFYVLFENKFQEEYKNWQNSSEAESLYLDSKKNEESQDDYFKRFKNDYFNQYSQLGSQAKQMLLDWESGNESVVSLWKMMNGWVYEGFEETYRRLGVEFDKLYYESDTYLLGKKVVNDGLEAGVFYKNEDGSVWIDLEDAGMDQKIVLRSDGTSVYITQDIGTAMLRYQDYKMDEMVYVVADEQDYHFQVLFETLKRLNQPYANGLHHLNYGMVDLPSGRMKSREGTVVDADDLMNEVIAEAKANTDERGELSELSAIEKTNIVEKIGLGALKYHIIKVNPKKRMIFDPAESLDMHGQTGPYIQNAFVRIQSILRKVEVKNSNDFADYLVLDIEKELVQLIMDFPFVLQNAAERLDPSEIANYSFNLAKHFHRYYHEVRILKAESESAFNFRILLCQKIAESIEESMKLLGIEMPERM